MSYTHFNTCSYHCPLWHRPSVNEALRVVRVYRLHILDDWQIRCTRDNRIGRLLRLLHTGPLITKFSSVFTLF